MGIMFLIDCFAFAGIIVVGFLVVVMLVAPSFPVAPSDGIKKSRRRAL